MRYVVVALILLSLCGCYGDIHMVSNVGRNAVCNADTSELVFFKFIKVFRPAKGLWALPDGGKPKVLSKNISLYHFNVKRQELFRVFNFGTLRGNRDSWKTFTSISDSCIVFRITPTIGWDTELRYPKRGIDSSTYNYFNSYFCYHFSSSSLERIPSFNDSVKLVRLKVNEVESYTSNISALSWGVDIDSLYPQSKHRKLKDICKLKHGQSFRLNMIEQMANELTESEIDKTIRCIYRFVGSTKGYERYMLQIQADTTVYWLNEIRNSK